MTSAAMKREPRKEGNEKMTRDELLTALRNIDGLPETRGPRRRTIYECGEGSMLKPSGRFHIDFATFPGGLTEEVPLSLIRELEAEGIIRRESPKFKSWILVDEAVHP